MSTTSDREVIEDLRRLAPAPPSPPWNVADRARLGRDVAAAIAVDAVVSAGQSERHSRRNDVASRFGLPALVAACLAAVVGLGAVAVFWPDSPSNGAATVTSRPVVADPGAVQVLNALSTVARRSPGIVSGSGAVAADQYVYVRSEVISNEGGLGEGPELGAVHEREIWLTQNPSSSARGSVIRELGQDWPIVEGGPSPVGLQRPTYAWLAALPTDPDALLAELESQVRADADQGPDQALFDGIGNLLREALLPPKTAAALYQAVTRIPGVQVVPGATDAIGRVGVGISRTDTVFHTRSMWIFAPDTATLLGTRDYFTSASGDGSETLFNATAVMERGVADRPGADPRRIVAPTASG